MLSFSPRHTHGHAFLFDPVIDRQKAVNGVKVIFLHQPMKPSTAYLQCELRIVFLFSFFSDKTDKRNGGHQPTETELRCIHGIAPL